MTSTALLGLVLLTLLTVARTSAQVCIGDCDHSGSVTVDEIITMVNIALGNFDVSRCSAGDPNGDDRITIDEILTAVSNAVNKCTSTVTPTPTSIPIPS